MRQAWREPWAPHPRCQNLAEREFAWSRFQLPLYLPDYISVLSFLVTASHHPARINLKLRDLSQLFNSMDPSPFLDRDLDHDAEEFIVSWSRELPRNPRIELTIHLSAEPEPKSAGEVESAVQHYFAARAEIKQREFRLLLRHGHVSLSIGLIFLAVCLVASGLAGRLADNTAAGIVSEGFIIAGWVAMWRPIQIYLYDWWPLREEWQNLQRLARMRVKLVLPRAGEAGVHPLLPPG